MRRAYMLLLALAVIVIIGGTIIASFKAPFVQSKDPATSIDHEKTYAFIENVLPIDSSQYNITFKPPLASTPVLNNSLLLETFALESNNSSLTLICDYYSGILYSCILGVDEGSIIVNQTYANTADAAKSFLEKYQAHSNLDSTKMISLLTNVDPTQNTTSVSGDLKLTITHKNLTGTVFGDSINFRWVRVINGCEYLFINAGFTDGVFSSFVDHRVRYSIGDTAVNISREQAVVIAMEAIEDYSYRMSDNWVVTGFNVTESRAVAVLQPQTKEGNVLYPAWSITLPLNGTWPGSVTELLVGIWAGSEEVYLVHHQAYAQLYHNPALT